MSDFDKDINVPTNDTISRQAAIDALQKEINKGIPPFDDVMGSIRCGVRLARNIIEDMPSAQPEIIRCGECRYYRECEIFGKKITLCKRREYDSMYTEPDDFCSRGARREE